MVASLENSYRGININRGKPVFQLRLHDCDYFEVLEEEFLQVLAIIDIDPGAMSQQSQITALFDE